MENLGRTAVECVLVLACCLIIAPTLITPSEDLRLNSENAIPISEFPYPGDEPSEDAWNYDYPRFPVLLQEKLSETKRRSFFFPVRGKKVVQNSDLPDAKSETLNRYAFYPESTKTDGAAFFPAARRMPHSFYKVPQNGQRLSNELPLENVSAALDSTEPSDWLQTQKRRSSFMPMRGRKRFMYGNHYQLAKRYFPSRVQDDLMDPAFDDDVSKVMNEVQTYEKDKIYYPKFHETKNKEGTNFLDRDQIAKHIRFVKSHSRPLDIDDVGNGVPISSSKSFFSDKNIPTKRALSFVPTRGRRGMLDDFVSGFLPQVAMSNTFGDSAGQTSADLSSYKNAAEGEAHARYRRASAFLPMRGRKSTGSPFWLAYNYIPHQMLRSDYVGRRTENMEQKMARETQGQIYGEGTKYTGSRRQKKGFQEGLQSALSQKLRTAVVMKRPSLSFFAARGKRLNGSGMENIPKEH